MIYIYIYIYRERERERERSMFMSSYGITISDYCHLLLKNDN